MNGLENFIAATISAAEKNITADSADYTGDDGLLYCGKCRTRKQKDQEFFFGVRRVPCLCKCASEDLRAKEAEERERERAERITEMRRNGFPESNMQEWTFSNDDGENPKLMRAMRKYADNFGKYKEEGKGLLLYGGTGAGKSFAAACIANALIDRGIPVMMTDFSRIATTAQGMWEGRQEYFDSFNRYPLLILDDFAAERKTEYMGEQVFKIINARYTAKLPVIVTTNLTADDLKRHPDITYQRAISRLYEMCVPVKFEGKDRRREKLKDNYTTMMDELGLTGDE